MKIQEAIENFKYLISDDCTDNQTDFIEEILKSWRDLKLYEENDLLDVVTFWIE